MFEQKPNSLRIVNDTDGELYYYFSNIDKDSEDYKNKKRQLYITKKPDPAKYYDCNDPISSLDTDILDIDIEATTTTTRSQ